MVRTGTHTIPTHMQSKMKGFMSIGFDEANSSLDAFLVKDNDGANRIRLV